MSPADMRASAWCAICVEDIVGEVVREPLGRLGALVAVCADCRTVTPTATYGRQAYTAPEQTSTPRTAEQRRAAEKSRKSSAKHRDFKRMVKRLGGDD